MSDGIKSMRSNTEDRKPQYYCDNCKCNRYTRCTCLRSWNKKEKVEVEVKSE